MEGDTNQPTGGTHHPQNNQQNENTVYGHNFRANEAAAIYETVDPQLDNYLGSDGSSLPQTSNTDSDQSNSSNADGEQNESTVQSNEAAIQDRQNDGEPSDSSMDISSGNEPTTQPNRAMTDS